LPFAHFCLFEASCPNYTYGKLECKSCHNHYVNK
jgi:hypothetical protein